MEFTIEEIFLIRSCKSKNKLKIIDELKGYSKSADYSIAEMANNALEKMKISSDKEFSALMDYPL